MSAIPLRNHQLSRSKISQTLFMTKVCFPSKNEHILVPQLIQPINKSGNILQHKMLTRKANKQIQNNFFEVQSHAPKLFQIYNLEDIHQQNLQNIQSHNSNNTLRRFSTKIIKNQESLTKRCENKMRIRSQSTEIQTNRTNNFFKQEPTKKVRFYEKVEFWIINNANDIDVNYKYFEHIKLK